jgi:acetyltransferase-like isoleucine patch superfamily enzyme
VAIGVGSRIDIGPEATLTIGRGTYFSPNVRVVISRGLSLGSDCAIGWDVQFLDDNFHGFGAIGASLTRTPKEIVLGDHVWVGSHALIYRGVEIARGCVVAGGAVVTRSFLEPNTLIAGNPAQVIRSGVNWD